MTMDLDPEEAAALEAATNGADDGGARVAVVSLRDFSEPRTLSADRIARIRKTLSARLGAIANGLAGPLRGHPQLALGEIAEMNAHGLFDGFVRPFLVHGFLCNGQQGWLIWDAAAARIACDLILSGPTSEVESGGDGTHGAGDPVLTRTERRVIASLLDSLLGTIVAEFSLAIEPGEVWQEPEEMTTLEDLGPDADSRRMLVHLSFESEGREASDMRLYLPGIVDPEDETEPVGADAPHHLAPVDLDLSALLGGTEVPLAELLAIEVGDVIPLDSRIGEPIEIEIEETICAEGRFGAVNGRLAVAVDQVGSMSHLANPSG